MKQQRGRIGGIADSVANTVKRRQQSRESRVVVYDAAGKPRVVPRETSAHDDLLETAELLVEAAGE